VPHLYPTFRQLQAAQRVLSRGPDPIDWDAWEEFKELIASAPLETDEDAEEYVEGPAA
jgi:hypothetical protein